MTIRLKVCLWHTAITSLVGGIGSILLYMNFVYMSNRAIDIFLTEEAHGLTNSLVSSPSLDLKRYLARLLEEPDMFKGNKYIQLINKSGEVIVQSENLEQDKIILPLNPGALQTVLSGKDFFATGSLTTIGPYRMIVMPISDKNGIQTVIQMAVSTGEMINSIHELRLSLLIVSPIILLVIALAGWYIAGKTLKPIADITRKAEKIRAENLKLRLVALHPGDEIGRLVGVLNSMLERLESSFRQITQFTADASHEIKSPLAAVRCGLEIALSQKRTVQEYKQILNNSLQDICRLSQVVDNLFTLAKADSGQETLNLRPIKLDRIIQEVSEQAELLAEIKGITFSAKLAQEISILGDEFRLRQLFFNLLDNAIKYTNNGGDITVSLEAMDGQAKITVADTGIGIPEEDLPYIFDRFYRVDKARSHDANGGGLGLSICQWIAQQHKGNIEIESKWGEGSTFTTYLPINPLP